MPTFGIIKETGKQYIKHERECLSTFPNTERRVENTTCSGVFLKSVGKPSDSFERPGKGTPGWWATVWCIRLPTLTSNSKFKATSNL